MRRDKHVRIIIRPDGTCAVEAINFADAGCRQVTRQITEALAGRTIDQRDKPEARNRPQAADRRLKATQ